MYDLIIIGSGPAGLTAGLYAGRYRLKSLVLEKLTPGGQIILSPWIDNYPGFPGGIATEELVEKMRKQVDEVGIGIEIAEVMEIKIDSEASYPLYNIQAQDKDYQAKSIIIATGAEARRLGVDGEERLIGKGVSYCATCDGPLYRGKEVVVVGGGDRAIEDAIFLASYAKKVILVHRRKEFRASEILVEKIMANPKIELVLDSVVEQISGREKVGAVKVKNLVTEAKSEIPCEGIFIFVGIKPNTVFVKNQLQLDESGFIITDNNLKTSKDGVFACGDCRSKILYQVINACGDAAMAAHAAHKYLMELK